MNDLLDNRYQILKKIGSGGMAIVYLARDLSLDRNVAIKVLRDEYIEDSDFRRHFQKEAVAIAKLSHNNIVGIYDIINDNGAISLVMEYVEGETLKEKINKEGPLPWRHVVKYGIQIANALAYAHNNHIIHKDVKSQNIIIDHHDNVKITDFGISQMMNNTTITHNKGILGSAHYFSPEQARGEKLSYETDIYSLGIVLYELLTGNLPFTGDNPVSVALKHIQDEAVSVQSYVRDIPESLAGIIKKCLEKNPENRFKTMSELSKALSGVSYHSPTNNPRSIMHSSLVNKQTNLDTKSKVPANKKKNFAKKKKKNNILLLAAIAFFVLLMTLFISKILIPPSELSVPNLVGMTAEDAESKLSRLELNLNVVDEVYNEKYEEGQIISQNPKKGVLVKKKETISVTVSKGSKDSIVPDLYGKSLDEATSLLKSKHLTVGNVKKTYSKSVKENKVISQSISKGEHVERGTAVDLEISLGEAPYVIVPNLIGNDINAAKTMLEEAHLSIGEITYQNSDEDNNTIIKQSISSGKKVDEYTTINLTVSTGKQIEKNNKDNADKYQQISYTAKEDGILSVELADKNGTRVVYLGKINSGTSFSQNYAYSGNGIFTVKLNDVVVDTISVS